MDPVDEKSKALATCMTSFWCTRFSPKSPQAWKCSNTKKRQIGMSQSQIQIQCTGCQIGYQHKTQCCELAWCSLRALLRWLCSCGCSYCSKSALCLASLGSPAEMKWAVMRAVSFCSRKCIATVFSGRSISVGDHKNVYLMEKLQCLHSCEASSQNGWMGL